jgi:hypothetical protein
MKPNKVAKVVRNHPSIPWYLKFWRSGSLSVSDSGSSSFSLSFSGSDRFSGSSSGSGSRSSSYSRSGSQSK